LPKTRATIHTPPIIKPNQVANPNNTSSPIADAIDGVMRANPAHGDRRKRRSGEEFYRCFGERENVWQPTEAMDKRGHANPQPESGGAENASRLVNVRSL